MLSSKEYGRWAPTEDGVTLTWSDLSVYVKQPQKSPFLGRWASNSSYKRIINNVTGAIEPGQLIAVMGPSGAGKSTLMTCLAHRCTGDVLVDGDVRVNGKSIGEYIRRLSGFMYQEDLFIGTLTVYEHLNLMARLKLDRRVKKKARQDIITNLMNELNLSNCSDTQIGGTGMDKHKVVLSGGERKRLAFATECLTNPKLLFCDEPTTGLDSSSASYLIKMLQKMTVAQNRTVLCTIHQPSSELMELFHQIILIANGRIAFIGSTKNALNFFKRQGYECPISYNIADFLMRTLAPTPGSENSARLAVNRICDEFAVSDYAREVELKIRFELHMAASCDEAMDFQIENYKPPMWPTKLFWLCYRFFVEIARDPQIQTIRLVYKVGLAIMVGLCFMDTLTLDQKGIQAIQGALFMLITENTFAPMYAALTFFPTQIPLFQRECLNGISTPLQFYLASLISMIPGLIVEPIAFVGVLFYIAGMQMAVESFLFAVLITMLVINVSSSCGVFFSTAFESVPIAMAYLVPFDYGLMITCGLFVNLNTLPQYISWIQHISWMMYANEALNILQWDNVTNITCETERSDLPCMENGSDVLERLSFSADNFWRDIICMGILYITFHLLGFICLRMRLRGKQHNT